MNRKILEVNHLDFNFATNTIFQDLNLKINNGTINTIIGPNKSGKSTLIRVLSGFYPTVNTIAVDNIILNNQNKDYYYEKIIQVTNKITFTCKTTNNEINSSYAIYNIQNPEVRYTIINLINLFSISNLLNTNPNELDNLSKIKVMIIKALALKPKVLLFDLDGLELKDKEKKELFLILNELKKEGLTIIYSSNDYNDIVYSDHVYVLAKKTIAISGPIKSVIKQDNLLIKLGIELPFMIDLSLKLQFYNVLTQVILSMKKMVNKLWK